ncbi:MAG TPA: hypothetical protein VFQ48_00230, partial [Pseudonocardiaceae bacterium]|nr:hypothetical protein [Pseudonocardiaceae bacterium]
MSLAPLSRAGVLVPPRTESGDAVGGGATTVTISHARTLRALPLDLLRTSTVADQQPVRLDDRELHALLTTLQANSEAASARLADNAVAYLATERGGWSPHHPPDVVAALHRILTRSRFLKGSRSCFPLETAMA